MFISFWKPKFLTKCENLIKIIKTKVELSKKKKNAVVRYLKNDMADLIRNGMDLNAYGRAAGLLEELKLIAYYNVVERFCECITSNAPLMIKQKECPEECKEAVQSLIYAAKFAEFRELRHLRELFSKRYGTDLEAFVSKELVEIWKTKEYTEDAKLQLMEEIATEFSLQWTPASLKQKNQQVREQGINMVDDGDYENGSHKLDIQNGFDSWKQVIDPEVHSVSGRSKLRNGSRDSARKSMSDFRSNPPASRFHGESYSNNVIMEADAPPKFPFYDGIDVRSGYDSRDEVQSQGLAPKHNYTRRGCETDRSRLHASLSKPASFADDSCGSQPNYYKELRPPYLIPKNKEERGKVPSNPSCKSVRTRPHNRSDSDSLKSKQQSRGIASELLQNDDDEEKIIDGLLLHYSKKPSLYELGDMKSLQPESRRASHPIEPKIQAKVNSWTVPVLSDYESLAPTALVLKGR